MGTQILSSDISASAVRFITEEVTSSGTSPRNFNITYNAIGYSNMLSHVTIVSSTAGMRPVAIMSDSSNNIYFSEMTANVIRQTTTSGTIGIIAGEVGIAGYTGDGGPAISGTFGQYPSSLAFDASGNLYAADAVNNVVRKINTSGTISTFAGNGSLTLGADGLMASGCGIGQSQYIGIGPSDEIYMTCNGAPNSTINAIRKVDISGIIHTVFGNVSGSGAGAYPGDGSLAISWDAPQITGFDFDSSNNMYVAIGFNEHMLIKVNSSGVMTKIAGVEGVNGYNGDSIPASGAYLNYPGVVRIDSLDNIYIQDQLNYRIRQINPSGIITTYAGNGVSGYTGDGGPATSASISPTDMCFDNQDNFYISDQNNGRIRTVNPSGTISTFAGYGSIVFTNGTYLLDAMFVPYNYINQVITNPPDAVRYCNISGNSIYVNLDGLAQTGFKVESIDKFIISYTTNE